MLVVYLMCWFEIYFCCVLLCVILLLRVKVLISNEGVNPGGISSLKEAESSSPYHFFRLQQLQARKTCLMNIRWLWELRNHSPSRNLKLW